MIERKQTMCVALSYVAIAIKISFIVMLKKWYFLIDVCNPFHSLRHLLIIKYGRVPGTVRDFI